MKEEVEKLKAYLKSDLLNLSAIAREAGVEKSLLSRFVIGERSLKPDSIVKLVSAVNVLGFNNQEPQILNQKEKRIKNDTSQIVITIKIDTHE